MVSCAEALVSWPLTCAMAKNVSGGLISAGLPKFCATAACASHVSDSASAAKPITDCSRRSIHVTATGLLLLPSPNRYRLAIVALRGQRQDVALHLPVARS